MTVSVGHCHPEVVAAVNEQSQILQHTTTIYLNHQARRDGRSRAQLATERSGAEQSMPRGRNQREGAAVSMCASLRSRLHTIAMMPTC